MLRLLLLVVLLVILLLLLGIGEVRQLALVPTILELLLAVLFPPVILVVELVAVLLVGAVEMI